MSEQAPNSEYFPRHDPILDVARRLYTPFNEKSEALLSQFKPRMDQEQKIGLLSQLQDTLQGADIESSDTDQIPQIWRQIGIVLTTAHVHYITEGTWPQVEEELIDAYQMADQSSIVHAAHGIVANEIGLLIESLMQKQYRL